MSRRAEEVGAEFDFEHLICADRHTNAEIRKQIDEILGLTFPAWQRTSASANDFTNEELGALLTACGGDAGDKTNTELREEIDDALGLGSPTWQEYDSQEPDFTHLELAFVLVELEKAERVEA